MSAAARDALQRDLLDFIHDPATDPGAFDDLAGRVLAWQVEAVVPYRRLVGVRGPGVTWRDAPLVPAEVFREVDLSTGAPPLVTFRTSGTTGAGRRGARRVPDLRLYHAAMTGPFVRHVLQGDLARRPWLSLVPRLEDSSLSHMVACLARGLSVEDRSLWAMTPDGLDAEAAWAWLQLAERPVLVLTTSFALANLLEARPAERATLPAGSQMMLTGGFKGRSTLLTEDALVELAAARLGLPVETIVPEYGMTELTSQAYGRPFEAPPWLRLRVVDPVTQRDVPAGAEGLVAFFDLLNLDNVSAILTSDLGALDDAGRLTLRGRAPGVVVRGCSLTAEELGLLVAPAP